MSPLSYLKSSSVAAAVLFAFATPAAAAEEAAAPDWTKVYSLSDRLGHVVGNPEAPTKLVEYASYTCSVCSRFEMQDVPKIKENEVAFGKVSFEIRNLVRDGIDLTVAVLARCGGKDSFFANHKYWMETQSQWLAGYNQITPETHAHLDQNRLTDYVFGVYTDMRLGPHAAKLGLNDGQAKSCLANRNMQSAVLTMSREATGILKINATPTLLVNGSVSPYNDYASIKSLLIQK